MPVVTRVGSPNARSPVTAPPVASPTASALRAMPGHHVGSIVGFRGGRWLVDFAENPHGALAARTTVSLDADAMRRAAESRQEVLLVFEGQHSDLPIVVGLLAPVPPVDATPPAAQPNARTLATTEAGDTPPTEAMVDGERVVFTASQEIVLRCGRASIHLLSDGSVRIRGTQLLSRASGTNRIRGGNVQIN